MNDSKEKTTQAHQEVVDEEQARIDRWQSTKVNMITAASTFGVTGIFDLAAHGGVGGAFLCVLAAFIASRHGDDMAKAVRNMLPEEAWAYIASKLGRKPRVLAIPKEARTTGTSTTATVKFNDTDAELQRESVGLDVYNDGGFCDTGPDDEIMYLGKMLNSGQPFNIHADRLFGEGLFVAGNQGSGKSVLLARLVEQFSKCSVPCVVFDLKPDFYTITRKFASAINAGHPEYAGQFEGSYYGLTVENVDDFIANVLTSG
ncbi:MAG TPA: DUF87 domain-containing protein, partial [Ktedonobacteraceae bacterium]